MLAAIREIAKVTLAGHGSGAASPEVATLVVRACGNRRRPRIGLHQTRLHLAQLHRLNYVWLGMQTRAVPCIMEPGWCCQHFARHESENPNPVFASEETATGRGQSRLRSAPRMGRRIPHRPYPSRV